MNKIYENQDIAIFEGFYESHLFNSDTEFYLNELLQDSEHPEAYEITEQNYKDYEKEVCKLHADGLMEALKENNINFVKKIEYHGMWSPNEYNFRTDKLQLKIDFNLNELKKYCFDKNRGDFNFYLHKKYTSYDGFISFIDNNVYLFEQTYKNAYKNKKDVYIDIMLDYLFIRAIFENETLENIYNKNLFESETDYKQKIYEQLTELQIEYATPVTNE